MGCHDNDIRHGLAGKRLFKRCRREETPQERADRQAGRDGRESRPTVYAIELNWIESACIFLLHYLFEACP